MKQLTPRFRGPRLGVSLIALALACLPVGLLPSGCAPALKTFAEYPAPAPAQLAHGQEGPEIDALLTAFYERPFQPQQLRSQLDAVLSRHPHSSRAHEVAGYLAVLDANTPAVIDHFLAAASDLDSGLTALYLWELDQWSRSASEDSRVQSLLEGLIREHPSADVRDRARAQLVPLLRSRLQLEAARAVSAQLGYLPAWNLIGPFDNDQGKGFLTSYPPQSKLALQEEYPGKLLPVRWHTVQTDPTGAVALDDLIAPKEFALGYLASFLGSDRAGPAELRLSVGDAVEVWWNDALVVSEETIDDGAADNLVVPVQLARGWN